MEIIFKSNNEKIFLSYWVEYIDKNSATFRYLLPRIESNLISIKNLLFDFSFVVVQNKRCVGICFLPIEENNSYLSISLSGGYTISPLAINDKVERFIFDKIDKIALEKNVKVIKFYTDSLIKRDEDNYLLKYNFVDTSSTTGIVALGSNNLWGNIRKHYKSMINKVLKDEYFEIFIMNENNADYSIHEEYRLLHQKCSGKVTRAKESFDKQFEMLQNNFATLIGLKFKGKFIGMQYFFHYQKTVIYASGADDPEYTKKGINIYHPILWKAQECFKDKKFDYLDYSQPFGYSLVQGFDDYYDEKQLNISYFKRGMGAKMVTLYRGIKYYDKSLFIDDMKKFEHRVIEN